jgi:hypothetical protein
MVKGLDRGLSLGFDAKRIKKDEILRKIKEFYLNSHDFNGLPVRNIVRDSKVEEIELNDILISLIREKKISLVFGDIHPNPHIKAFWEEKEEIQIEKLQKSNLEPVCAYPSGVHLKEFVDPSEYQDRPFTLRLALGEPQLSYLSFDLSVLEFYRNDPRYYYTNNDISGRIRVHEEYYESEKMASSDKVVLQTFGFSYDSELNRAVAVFLRYLSDLSPQHQQIWNAKKLKGDYKLHPDYYKIMIGSWALGVSIFDAFAEELHHVNEMCKLMYRPSLFKNELRENKKPRGFCFLIRPTLKEYNDFVHLLDKAISENINGKFFLNDVPFEYDEVRDDGKIVVRHKGTIQILDEWLKMKFRVNDRKPIEEMIATFKKIRKLRQHPAHAIDEDIFDQKYFRQQREIIIRAYEGIRLLRLIFADHPNVKEYIIPDWLQSGKIWTY